ncbi:MFS transporter [Ktedonosporobacter rubrisoli]|uniref:MFS transporter n=1 Tax=Ktedonosporobacter rubrisoli TaxID=2509675 RepID=A0A4P6JNY5_KTERU|nr:MFS transporter [Ktedonosporobacter rubrisoli]QBD76782.1 MFS transporter [Ktedonosporobacter rubrisoli]
MMTSFLSALQQKYIEPFPRPFWLLTAGSFVNRAGNLVMPFFVLYLTAQRGLSIPQATMIISMMGIGSLGASFLGGVLADHIGRRTTLLLSLVASGSLMLLLGVISAIPWLIAVALLMQFFSQLARPPLAATIADMAPPEQRTRAYSLRYWANNIGASIGPMVAGLLATVSYFWLFLGDGLTTLLFGAVIWQGVPETLPHKGASEPAHGTHQRSYLHTALSDPLLWCYSLLALVFNGIYTMWQVAMPLDLRAHGFNEVYYGAFSAANAVQVVCLGLLLTGLVTRFSRTNMLALAALLLGVGLGLYAWTHSVMSYLLGVFIWTSGEIVYYPLSTALIASISPIHLRGVYQGFFGTFNSLALLLAPWLGGLVLQYAGASRLWQGCLFLGLLSAVAYLVLGQLQQKKLFERKKILAEADVHCSS